MISRRKSADRLALKPKQPPTRQRKSIRKSASNVYNQKPVVKTRLPPKKQIRDSRKKYSAYDSNSKKKGMVSRVKSNRVVNYMSHRSSHKDLHSKNSNVKSYQSNLQDNGNKTGTQTSINAPSRQMLVPPKLQSGKPSSKYVSHNPYKSKAAPPLPRNSSKNELRRNSSRGKYDSKKSGRMLHYQEYMRKMHENKLRRKNSQKKISNQGSREEPKVYRSRVSSADVHRENSGQYNKIYGYKPLWFG